MSSLDYLDLCRLCLVKDRVSVPIFEDEGDVRQIFLKITACLPVKVSREDKLPKKICDDCVYKVELFYQFWNTTANAEKQLLQWLGEVGGLEENQSYVTEVLDSNVMKQERSSDSRLDASVMQVGGHQNNMDMGMIDNMSLITMPTGNEQFTSVPMDTTSAVQTVQAVPGSSTQTTHDQMSQNRTAVTHLVEEEEESEDEENSDDGCDNEEGLPVKEETEEDPSDQPLEPTTFVNVSIPCDEAGPSGLQQQKISEISEMTIPQTADGDSKTGLQTFCLQGLNNQFIFIKNEFETQQQLQQQQPFLLLQQSQQPLLVLQQRTQRQEISQQPLLIMQQPQQYPQKLILQSHQQQKLMLQSSDQFQNQRHQHDQQHIIDLNIPQDPLRITPILSATELQGKLQNFKLKVLKSLRAPKSRKTFKMLKFKVPVDEELKVKQKRLKMEDRLLHQEYVSRQVGSLTVQNFTSTQELPSTSKEIIPEIHISSNSGNDNKEFEDNDSKDDTNEEMKEIYTRIDYGGYRCNICQITRLDRRSMLFHISGQHSHLRPFKCGSCDKSFKRKYSLKIHQLSHNLKNAVETYPCEKCNYRTPNKVSLRYHYYRVHTNEYRFTCEHCGKRFKVKRELADHLVTHSGIQHMCDICGKLYRGEHLLRAHRRLHLDLYKFQCITCKKKLATEDGLTNHMKLHSRTYECDECGMKFPSKHNLIKHRNVHTREQAFPCPECGKVFADQSTQKVHSLIHAGLRPYRCNVCGLGFTQRTPMMLHWKKKHPEETDPPPPVILKNILKSIEEQNEKKNSVKNK